MKKPLLLCLLLVASICLQCKKEEPVNYPVLDGPEGSTGNVFSIGPTRKVYFSKGNLQYQASTNSWKFAENQWVEVGEDNLNVSSTYEGWIDLFIYGSSGYDEIYPYLTELPQEKAEISAMSISGTNYDWGVFNPIGNGGNEAGLWRVLTKEEMMFLLSRRDSRGHPLAGKGTLKWYDGNTKAGVFIMPDNYSGIQKSSFNWGEMEAKELERWGGVFLSASVNYYSRDGAVRCEDFQDVHVSSEYPLIGPDYPFRNEFFCIKQGVFKHHGLLTHIGAPVRLVQDCDE